MVIQLHGAGDAELELWATSRHLEPFEQLVKKPVKLQIASAEPTAVTKTRQRRQGHPGAPRPPLRQRIDKRAKAAERGLTQI
jgi:hypothetical protein